VKYRKPCIQSSLIQDNILPRNFWLGTYWNAIVGNGGAESACGWCKDKWGLSWQITPRVLTEAMAKGGDVAKRAFEAMMEMRKIDVAKIEAAVHDETV
jgi:predicted 3-demethylubiquinone-9 3-methyltransferase (glyoxalase superfamily)